MATNINTMLGMGLGPQDDMKALANSLRGEQGMGDYYSMSTLAPISQLGKTMQNRTNQAAQRGGVLRQAMEKEATRKAELSAANQQKQENYTATALAKTQAAKKVADVAASKRNLESFWHPTIKDQVLNLNRTPTGDFEDPNTGEIYLARDLTPYSAGTQGSKQNVAQQKYTDKKAGEEVELLLGNDIISQAITSPLMSAATGPIYDIPKQVAQFTGMLPEVQSQQNLLNEISLKAAAPTLDKLGVNPTDKDLQVAFDSVPSKSDEPRTWIDWYKTRYMPRLLAAVRNGSRPELEEQLREEMNDAINEAEFVLKNEQDKNVLSLPATSATDTEIAPQETAPTQGWGKVRVN